MTRSEELRQQAAAAYRTGIALARSGHQVLAEEAFAETYRLVAEAREAREGAR